MKMSRSDPVTPTTTADSSSSSVSQSRYISRSASRRAVRCRFFRNGDRFFPGHVLPVSMERYGTLENLNADLGHFLNHPLLPSGVKTIFTLDGEKVHTLDVICNGGDFVAASSDSFKKFDYRTIPGTASPSKKIRRGLSKKSESFSSNTDGSLPFDKDFIRARNISVFSHGNKPRKMRRILLNKKTVHSMDGILEEISLALGTAIFKLVSIPNGLAISKLEDLFDHCTIFIAMGSIKAKITPQDLQLHADEIKTLPSKITPRSRRSRPVTAGHHRENHRERSSTLQTPSRSSGRPAGLTRSFSVHQQVPKEIHERLLLGDKLGSGYFAEVKFAIDRKTGDEVAVKIIDKHKCRGKEHMVHDEIRIMQKVRHPFVVEFVDSMTSHRSVFLITELVRGGDLYDFITEAEDYCPKQACQFTYNMAAALHYLHSFRIIHRDIKPENLLVYSYPDATKVLKLCDFGLATEIKRGERLTYVCGTATYVAPEIITSIGYGVEVDNWAMGVIVYILLCGFPPFRADSGDQRELFAIILEGFVDFPTPFWDDVDERAKDLILKMLVQEAPCRLSAEDVLHHEWLNDPSNQVSRSLVPLAASMPSLHQPSYFD